MLDHRHKLYMWLTFMFCILLWFTPFWAVQKKDSSGNCGTSHHSGGRSRTVHLKPAWAAQWVPFQQGLDPGQTNMQIQNNKNPGKQKTSKEAKKHKQKNSEILLTVQQRGAKITTLSSNSRKTNDRTKERKAGQKGRAGGSSGWGDSSNNH